MVAEVSPCLKKNQGKNSDAAMEAASLIAFDPNQVTSKTNRSNPKPGDPCHTIPVGAHAPMIAGYVPEISNALCQRDFKGARPEAAQGAPLITTEAFGIPGNWIGRKPENGGNATEPMHEVAPNLTRADRHGVAKGIGVRRLTPKECCRLQGFKDDYLDIIFRGKPACDGPKYRALGNSMAVPVMTWIGKRIQEVHQIPCKTP